MLCIQDRFLGDRRTLSRQHAFSGPGDDARRDEFGFVLVTAQRAFHQQAKVRVAQLALFGHLGQQVVVDLAGAVARLGPDDGFLARLGVVEKVVVIAATGFKAFVQQALFKPACLRGMRCLAHARQQHLLELQRDGVQVIVAG